MDEVWKQVGIVGLTIAFSFLDLNVATLAKGSLNSMLKATDPRFATLRCSPLYGLSVAVTGISREERLEVNFGKSLLTQHSSHSGEKITGRPGSHIQCKS